MKRQFAGTLEAGERVDATFVLKAKEMRAARTGEAYLSMEFADRTGRIAGIMFRPRREAEEIPVGTVVQVRGPVTAYRGVLRVSAESVRPAAEYDLSELLPSSTRDEKELLAALRALIRSVRDPSLAAVVRRVFADAGFVARFKRCPASQSRHHAYLGGLLEHTVNVATACREIAGLYALADADLLLAGALLHDVGVADELSFDTGIAYTDDGRLLGHALLGERRVRAALDALGDKVPSELASRLSHVVLAHHGEASWGTCGAPCTLEALILHHADEMDVAATGFIEAASSAGRVQEAWTDAGNAFKRALYVPRARGEAAASSTAGKAAFARTA